MTTSKSVRRGYALAAVLAFFCACGDRSGTMPRQAGGSSGSSNASGGAAGATGPTDNGSGAEGGRGSGVSQGGSSTPGGAGGAVGVADAGAAVDGKDAAAAGGRSAGCGKAASGSGDWQALTMTIRNARRDYRLFVPKTYGPARAYPLIFVLHGSGGSGSSGDIAAFANTSKEDAILIAPSGIAGQWSLDVAGPDFELLDKLRASVGASHCVDERRVFSYGFSMGGAMSTVYACGRPGVLRAFASQRGGLPAGMPNCSPSAAWLANSTMDGVVVPSWYEPVHKAFAQLNGCGSTTKPTPTPPCVQREGCRPGNELVQCAITGTHNPDTAFAIPAAWRFFNDLQ